MHHCGSCATDCLARSVHANWGCLAGACQFQGCHAGYYDLDSNGTCEYACTFRSLLEACNGIDDNCNGQIDGGVVAPSPVRVCGVSPSAARAECTSAVAVSCVAGAWQCTFPAGVCPGGCSSNDEVCDALDNDCDGVLNENVAGSARRAPPTTGCRRPGTGRAAPWGC